jgi:hypothetical protein
MHPHTKAILKVRHEKSAHERDQFAVRVQQPETSEAQQMMIANQAIPFYRGHVLARGVQPSPLND